MADPQPAAKSSGLKAKKGGLPVWAWVAGGLVFAYVAYKYLSNTGALSSVSTTSTTAAPSAGSSTDTTGTDGSLGLTTTAGSPTDTGTSTSDLLTALGTQNSNLLSALETQTQDVAGLAQSQITAAQTNTSLGSFNTQTQPAVSAQPGGSMAPIIEFVSPNVVTQPAPQTSAPHATSSVSKFYTYKTQVPLSSGQTVHYTPGRGYYAAAAG